MRLFRKRGDDEPVDMSQRSPELGLRFQDLAVLHQLMQNGAKLTEPRHVLYYPYAPSEDVAQAMKREARSRGTKPRSASRCRRLRASGRWCARPTV